MRLGAGKGQARGGREPSHQDLGPDPGLAEPADGGVPVPLGQPPAVGPHEQGQVGEGGRLRAQGLVEQELRPVEASRSSPRTTSAIPMARSSTTQASW